MDGEHLLVGGSYQSQIACKQTLQFVLFSSPSVTELDHLICVKWLQEAAGRPGICAKIRPWRLPRSTRSVGGISCHSTTLVVHQFSFSSVFKVASGNGTCVFTGKNKGLRAQNTRPDSLFNHIIAATLG